jgi:hypothetical protein
LIGNFSSLDPPRENVDETRVIRGKVTVLRESSLELRVFRFLFWIRSALNTVFFTLGLIEDVLKKFEYNIINTYAIFTIFSNRLSVQPDDGVRYQKGNKMFAVYWLN